MQGIVIELFGSATHLDTTDVNGEYSFNNLLPGLYGVREKSLPLGTVVTLPSEGEYQGISLAPGQVVTDKDFGNFQSLISGKKFNDLNDNGVDDGELGLAGWTVEIRKAADSTLVKSAVTDASGNYNLSVPPGTYLLKEVGKDGWRQTLPAGGAWYTGIYVDTVSGATSIAGKNFGNFEYGKIRVELTIDLNGDGVKQSADVIALPSGVRGTFVLSKNGIPVETAQIGSTVSSFTFDSLNQGIYRVEEVPPAGWIRTAGGIGGIFSKVIGGGGVKDTARYLNFALNSVAGYKFSDLNRNGVREPNEPLVPGWKIKLSGAANRTTTTDSLGLYAFTNLGPGTYTVSESLQTGWVQTFPAAPVTYAFTANGALQLSVHPNTNFGNHYFLTDVEGDQKVIPKEFALYQNYPNPFNPVTAIKFDIPKSAAVSISVYNLLGQVVASLVENETYDAGRYTLSFDAAELPSGIYFYRITALPEGGDVFTRVLKMLLVR